MSSAFQKLTDGIIFYSLALSEFERLDFRNDALAGVRANYFNSNLRTQEDETEISIENVNYKLSYKLSSAQPLSWKVSGNQRPYQSAKRETGGVYCVKYYSESGAVYKCQYFNCGHIWVRTEYFDRLISDKLICRIFPCTVKGVVLLVKEMLSDNGSIHKSVLFPSSVQPRRTLSALAYTNAGMVWYDESFMPDGFFDDVVIEKGTASKNSFNLDASKFSSNYNPDSILDLSAAGYLEASDFKAEDEITDNNPDDDACEAAEYSAYDRIEKILIEAHKTNKNLFGEVLEQAEGIDKAFSESEDSDIPDTLESLTENGVTDKPEELSDTEALNEQESISFEPAQEEKCDSVVSSKSGSYSYFGKLDENGMRTERGRTVSPEGFTAYEGEYKNDKRNGFGVFYYKNGGINYVGEWLENKRNGSGVGYRSSDGTMHAGKWSLNNPDGCGARFDRDGNFIDVAFYSCGVKNGKSVAFDENGNVCISLWKDGEKISERIIE